MKKNKIIACDPAALGSDETVYFEVNNTKEVSKKDLKTMRKFADKLRKEGYVISPVPIEEKRTIFGPRKWGRTYNLWKILNGIRKINKAE